MRERIKYFPFYLKTVMFALDRVKFFKKKKLTSYGCNRYFHKVCNGEKINKYLIVYSVK